jgi:hypothetical protein
MTAGCVSGNIGLGVPVIDGALAEAMYWWVLLLKPATQVTRNRMGSRYLSDDRI